MVIFFFFFQVVKLKNVNYTVKVQRSEAGYATVGSKLTDCLLPCLKPPMPKEDFAVLSDFSAFLMPGSITLVCGPPGCGKHADTPPPPPCSERSVQAPLAAGKARRAHTLQCTVKCVPVSADG